MAIFGRESEADRQRAERVKGFVEARSPYALISAGLGALSVLDFWTLVLGVIAGVAAILLGMTGLRELRRKPGLLGRRLCYAGMGMGALGLTLSFAFWVLVLREGAPFRPG